MPEQEAAQGALSSAEPLDEEARPAGEEAEPSDNTRKTFQNVVFVPRAVTEMRKAGPSVAQEVAALPRLPAFGNV